MPRHDGKVCQSARCNRTDNRLRAQCRGGDLRRRFGLGLGVSAAASLHIRAQIFLGDGIGATALGIGFNGLPIRNKQHREQWPM
jgi:hypothetical protein